MKQIYITEEQSGKLKEALDWEAAYEGRALEDLLNDFTYDKKHGVNQKKWRLIPAQQYHTLLKRYMENPQMAKIPYNIVYDWFNNIIIPNAIDIEYITQLAGHSQYCPWDEVGDYFGEDIVDYETGSDYLDKIGFYDWCVFPDGTQAWSDYGLQPLFKTINEFQDNSTAEDILILINRCLDVAHCRGDLSSAFIEGGKRSCDMISNSLNESKKKKMKTPISAMTHVGGKVNVGIMDAVCGAVCESSNSNNIETWYRGYNGKYGINGENSNVLWLATDASYAKTYGNRVKEYKLDMSKCNIGSVFDIDDLCRYDFDYYDGPDDELINTALENGIDGYCFEANYDNSECMCLWSNKPIISERDLTREEYDAIDEYDNFDYQPYLEINESKKKKRIKKPISAMAQVGGKVNAGLMDGITCGGMMENTINETALDFEYHYTSLRGLIGMMESDSFNLNQSKYEKNRAGDWFMSLTRIRSNKEGYGSEATKSDHPVVRIELDGRKLNNIRNVDVRPYDFVYNNAEDIFNDRKPADLKNARGKNEPETAEAEDSLTIRGEKGQINDAIDYVRRIDILLKKTLDSVKDWDKFLSILDVYPDWKEKIHFFTKTKYFNAQINEIPLSRVYGIYGEKVKQYSTSINEKAMIKESLNLSENGLRREIDSLMNFISKKIKVKPFPKIIIDDSEQDGLFIKTGYYLPDDKSITIFTKDRHPKDCLRSFAHEMIHHWQNLNKPDLNWGSGGNLEDDSVLRKIEAEAYLKGNILFREWTEAVKDEGKINESVKKKTRKNDEGKNVPEVYDKCGGKVVVQIHGEPIFICKECGKYFGTVPFTLNENVENEALEPDEVDLSSFNIKRNLNPKFWKDERLDSRVRMRLLDIADDFIEFLGIDWVKPEDIIITGSIANFNWNKKYSDIDLHIIINFDDVDERKEFVKQYFDSQKKLWNEQHGDIRVCGFPVELYVQDVDEEAVSSGVYSLEKDKWIETPDIKKISRGTVHTPKIRKKVSEYTVRIDSLIETYEANKDDEHSLDKIYDAAEKLFDSIKSMRKNALEKTNNEYCDGNLIFKTLRRLGYIEKIVKLKQEVYNKKMSML